MANSKPTVPPPIPAAAPAPATRERIDTHFHYYPPSIQKSGGLAGPLIASWSRAKALEEMDRNGVRTGMLSMASFAWGLAS